MHLQHLGSRSSRCCVFVCLCASLYLLSSDASFMPKAAATTANPKTTAKKKSTAKKHSEAHMPAVSTSMGASAAVVVLRHSRSKYSVAQPRSSFPPRQYGRCAATAAPSTPFLLERCKRQRKALSALPAPLGTANVSACAQRAGHSKTAAFSTAAPGCAVASAVAHSAASKLVPAHALTAAATAAGILPVPPQFSSSSSSCKPVAAASTAAHTAAATLLRYYQNHHSAAGAADDTSQIYILELAGGKVYVGKSNNVTRRVDQHVFGAGSEFTRRYKPTGRMLPRLGRVSGNSEAAERDETLRYMYLCGIQNVRGWRYTQVALPTDLLRDAEMNIRETFDLCRRCGHSGHFVQQCRAKMDRYGKPI